MRLSNVIAAAAVTASTAPVNALISGLDTPTSFAIDADTGIVIIAEKSGRLRYAASLEANSTSLLADFTSRIYDAGDLGLTSIELDDGYLWATYSLKNEANQGACNADAGECYAFGRLSKFPVTFSASGVATINPAAEEVVIEGSNYSTKMCAQFQKNGIASISKSPDGYMYLSVGAGSSDTKGEDNAVDYGQYSGNPCATGSSLAGAFRSQDLNTFAGKVVRVETKTHAVNIVAKGLHDPWRFSFSADGSTIYVADTGIDGTEEINLINLKPSTSLVHNYGFPCYEAEMPIQDYFAANASTCLSIQSDAMLSGDLFSYNATTVASQTGRVALSAVAVYGDRLYFGDYMAMGIFSVDKATGTDLRKESGEAPVFPVHMRVLYDRGLAYVDVASGSINVLPLAQLSSGAESSSLGHWTVAAAALLLAAGYLNRDE